MGHFQHYIVSTQQMNEIDRRTVNEFHIPILTLMEKAGKSVSDECIRHLENQSLPKPWNICVVCGGGNNGGDGYVAARYLLEVGVQTTVFSLKPIVSIHGETLENCTKVQPSTVFSDQPTFMNQFDQALKKSHLIVDAMLGTGLKKVISNPIKEIIDKINSSTIPILSVDIPSGLNGDNGNVLGNAVQAQLTVTMGAYKKGLLTPNSHKYTGKIVVADIGFPDELFKNAEKAQMD